MRGMIQLTGSMAALLLVLCGGGGVTHAEITPMSRERMAEAEQTGGSQGGDDLIIYKDICRTITRSGVHAFDVVITTPFGVVADTVFESRKQGRPLDLARWPLESSQKQSVIVSVDPVTLFGGDRPAPPVSVKSVVLRRAERIIDARRADTHDVQFPGLETEGREYRGGAFYFPLEPFASALGALEIVVILDSDPAGAEAVLKLSKSDLAKMR